MNIQYNELGKQRLDKFLASELPEMSRSQWQKVIKSGDVLVNQKTSSVHQWLSQGDNISVNLKDKISQPNQTVLEPEIIQQTEEYLVLNKPSGLLVHPTERHETNTLISWLLSHYPSLKTFGDIERPGLVHRLDKDVSGLIIVALTPQAYDWFKQQFIDRTVEKKYLTLVHGNVQKEAGEVSSNLARDKATGLIKAYTDKKHRDIGKVALTRYQVLKHYTNYTLLEVQIITGRTHQIRTHLQSIGHGIVGDPLYLTKDIRKKKKQYLDRPFLHAAFISFQNLAEQKVSYEAPLPEELDKFLQTL